MFSVQYANLSDVEGIINITKQAFEMYRSELHSDAPVAALSETKEDVKNDIKNNHVLVAKSYDKILGCIRFEQLSDDLAYIYRFSVDPDEHNAGIGSILLDYAIRECVNMSFKAVCLHTNTRYYKLARYYYGKQFYVHSTSTEKGYIRALFIKELAPDAFATGSGVDLAPAFEK